MTQKNESSAGKKRIKMTTVRNIVTLVAFILLVVGLCVHTGFGTYSSAGFAFIASVCPLGALESIFGSFTFVPRLVIALVVMIVIVFFVGRGFCGWICPVPPISGFFKTKKRKEAEAKERSELGEEAYERYQSALAASDGDAEGLEKPQQAKAKLDSRHLVLCGALGSAAIFGFPVFCLICPVGLTCGFLVLLMRLMGVGELSWGLLIFPVVVILELTVLRDYCSKICPIAALFSLVSRFNRTLRPKADTSLCLRDTEGTKCHACSSACPAHIDPRANFGEVSVDECTRCGRCATACPAHAIKFPVISKK